MRRSEIENTRAEPGASPRISRKAAARSAGIRILRGLSPLPTMASCASPVSRGITCDQVRPASSETRSAPKYATSNMSRSRSRSGGAEQQVQLDLREKPLRRLARSLPELDERRGVEAGVTDLMRKAEERLHGGDVGVDGRGAARGAVCLDAHSLERVLHVIDGRAS